MRRCITLLTGLLFWAMIVAQVQADNAAMTHIVFRIIDPNIPEGHFALAPKEIWRIGTRYLRLEEAPDPDRGIHGLVIVDEPHTFMINRYDNRGMHLLDPGPTFEVHVPLFPSRDESDLSQLEFGREWEFFSQRNARPMPDVKAGDRRFKAYMLEIDGATLILFTEEETGNPVQVAYKSEESEHIIRYDNFEAGLEPDMNLFKVPAGVKISEAEQ